MAVSGTLYTPSHYHRTWRVLIAAQHSGAHLKVVPFVPGTTDTDPLFLSKFPPATVPVFESDDGTCLFDANAIAYYVGTEQLRGGAAEHLVTQWVNFADNAILPSVATWVYPCLGITQFNKQNTEKAQSNLKTVLSYINSFISNSTFLVGDRLSQADVTVFTALHPLFTHVLDPNNRKSYPHLVRWYTTIANQPEVLNVVPDTQLCEKEAHFDPKKYAELHAKDGKQKPVKNEEKKQPPKHHKKDKKQAPKKSEEESDAGEEVQAAPKPSSNPMAALPSGGFDMDAFKRVYSNEDIEKVAIPYFWDKFDPETHSIWFCEYKYPEELGMTFMSCNLIGGMFQRLEKMCKFAFGSMCIFGEANKSTISGVFFWRGTGLAFELSPDFQVDYESYDWRKLDPTADETKQLVHDYFCQEFKDKPFAAGKIFK